MFSLFSFYPLYQWPPTQSHRAHNPGAVMGRVGQKTRPEAGLVVLAWWPLPHASVLPGSYVGGGGGGNGPPSFTMWAIDLAARMVAIKSSCFLRQFDCFFGGSGWNAWNVENYYIDGVQQPTHLCSFRQLGCSHNRASCMMPPPHTHSHTPMCTHTIFKLIYDILASKQLIWGRSPPLQNSFKTRFTAHVTNKAYFKLCLTQSLPDEAHPCSATCKRHNS